MQTEWMRNKPTIPAPCNPNEVQGLVGPALWQPDKNDIFKPVKKLIDVSS
jgi:hypothetical protein